MQGKSKKPSAIEFAKEIWRQTPRKFTAEEKIKIVLEAMRGEETITAVYRKYGIYQNNYGSQYLYPEISAKDIKKLYQDNIIPGDKLSKK